MCTDFSEDPAALFIIYLQASVDLHNSIRSYIWEEYNLHFRYSLLDLSDTSLDLVIPVMDDVMEDLVVV